MGTTPEIEFEVPSWSRIYSMLLKVADEVRENDFDPDVIVGVSRGGWFPARVLSDLLGNPNLANVKAEFYVGVGETRESPTLTQPVSVCVEDKKVLVVDEVADTGKSLKLVKSHISDKGAGEIRVATVYYKPWSVVSPDYYGKKTTSWVVFPWEMKETIRKIVDQCRKGDLERETEKLIEAGACEQLVKRFLKDILEDESC